MCFCHWETRRQHNYMLCCLVTWRAEYQKCSDQWLMDFDEGSWRPPAIYVVTWGLKSWLGSLYLMKLLTVNILWSLKCEPCCWGTGVIQLSCSNYNLCKARAALLDDYLRGYWSHKEWQQELSGDEACNPVAQVFKKWEGTGQGTSRQQWHTEVKNCTSGLHKFPGARAFYSQWGCLPTSWLWGISDEGWEKNQLLLERAAVGLFLREKSGPC